MVFNSIKKAFSSKDGEDRASLSKKVQASPNDPQVRQKLGIFMLRAGEVVEGIDQLARSAIIYEKDGFAGKAVAVIRQILKHDPKNNDFQKWLIRLLAAEGLFADAHAEIKRVASDPSRFNSDDSRVEFFRQISGYMPDSPLPCMLVSDIFVGQRKRLEAADELKKAVMAKTSSEMKADIVERIRGLVGQGGSDFAIFESCGFMYIALEIKEEGLALLSRVVSHEEDAGRKDRVSGMKEIIKSIQGGWDPSSIGAFSFEECVSKRAAKVAAPPATAPQAAASSSSSMQIMESATSLRAVESTEEMPEASEEEEDEDMVRDALGRLQAKVHEEVGESDFETRYNLGIAYKEMGLLDEAATEFRLSMKNPDLLVGASSLLADTLADKGDIAGAFAALDEALGEITITETQRRDLQYHKAALLSLNGREEEAGSLFVAIADKFPGYRDVDARAKQYRS
ncbi:MAG: tetratricopeptide repeat protein [Syntrophorhabdaceae bacterium]|nr:tetratricopeptide repeat protein [Syntrophorhabdaceae bacterium]